MNYKNNIHLNIQAPQGYRVRRMALTLNVSFISSKDDRDFKTTAEGLIEEKARLESRNEWKPR